MPKRNNKAEKSQSVISFPPDRLAAWEIKVKDCTETVLLMPQTLAGKMLGEFLVPAINKYGAEAMLRVLEDNFENSVYGTSSCYDTPLNLVTQQHLDGVKETLESKIENLEEIITDLNGQIEKQDQEIEEL